MASYYAQNHLQNDWEASAIAAQAERDLSIEREARFILRGLPPVWNRAAIIDAVYRDLETDGEISEHTDALLTAAFNGEG